MQGLGAIWPLKVPGRSFLGLASFLNVCCFMGSAAVVAMATGASEAVLSTDLSTSDVSDAVLKKWIMAALALLAVAAQWPLRKRSDGSSICLNFCLPLVGPDFNDTLNFWLPLIGDISAGIAFAFALAISGMSRPSKVLGFVEPTRAGGWDPTLAFVMGGALLVSFPAINFFNLIDKAEPGISLWASRPIQIRHALGGCLFGAGWGLGGVCPMPGLVNTGAVLTGLDAKYAAFGAAMLGSAGLAMAVEMLLSPKATDDLMDSSASDSDEAPE